MPSLLQLSLCQPQADEIVVSTFLSLADLLWLIHQLMLIQFSYTAQVYLLTDIVIDWTISHQSPVKAISHRCGHR